MYDGFQVGSRVVANLVDGCVLYMFRLTVRECLRGVWGCILIEIRLTVV